MNLTMLPSRTVTATAFCIFKNDCRVEDKEILHAAKESAIIAIANNFQSEDAVLAEAINLYREADGENSQLTDEEIISIIALQD